MNKKEIQTVNKLLSSIKLRVHHTTNVRCSAVSCYAPDSKVYVVNASDVYTDKERNLNYMNTFHEFPRNPWEQ